jgi:hypothetical protein
MCMMRGGKEGGRGGGRRAPSASAKQQQQLADGYVHWNIAERGMHAAINTQPAAAPQFTSSKLNTCHV